MERFRDGVAPRRDAGENVAELEDDIAAALSDIERLAEESELYFQRSRELCGNQPVRRMRHAIERASRRWRWGRRDGSNAP